MDSAGGVLTSIKKTTETTGGTKLIRLPAERAVAMSAIQTTSAARMRVIFHKAERR